MANPLRIQIISKLKEEELSVRELSSKIKVEQSKLSHALANLRECNIVTARKEGKERRYSLNKKTVLPILKLIDEHSKLNCGGNCAFCTMKH
jgi:DNA-binding transcriptional ArsR family regulator